MLKDVDINLNESAWHILPTDETGYHLEISLDSDWGLHDLYPSLIQVTIHGDSYNTSQNLLTSFSVCTKRVTTIMRLDNLESNAIEPVCNTMIPSPLAEGDHNRSCHIDHSIKWQPLSYPNHLNSFPVTYALYNDGKHDISYFTSTQDSFSQNCLYRSFPTSRGLTVSMAALKIDEPVSISSIEIGYVGYYDDGLSLHDYHNVLHYELADTPDIYETAEHILWYEGMNDRASTAPNLSHWSYTSLAPITLQYDKNCPLTTSECSTCWCICGIDPNVAADVDADGGDDGAYMYHFASTKGYQNITFTYSVAANTQATDTEFCEVSYAVNNNTNKWMKLDIVNGMKSFVDKTIYLDEEA